MKVFITDLAAYNNMELIGKWVELGIEQEELSQTIKEILEWGEKVCKDGSIHEEYFISDVDFNGEEPFEKVEEYTNVYKLNEEVARFEELDLDDSSKKCVSFLIEQNIVSILDEALEKYEDCLIYQDMSFLDLAYQIVEEQYNLDDLPQFIANYFDYEALARDLELEGFYHEMDGDIFYYPY